MMLAILQSSVPLLVAFAVLGIAGGRMSAAIRHLILTAALLAALIAPFLKPIIPSWNTRTSEPSNQNARSRGLYARVQDQTEVFLNLNAGIKPAATRVPNRFPSVPVIWVSGTSLVLIFIF